MVGIEVGGVMCSHDGGESWEDHRRHCFADSHALAAHPAAPERVCQGAAGGVAISLDGGGSWSHVDRGIGRTFVWALAVDPVDPDLWYVSAAPSRCTPTAATGRQMQRYTDGAAAGPGRRRRRATPCGGYRSRSSPGSTTAEFALSDDAAELWRDIGVRMAPVRALAELGR